MQGANEGVMEGDTLGRILRPGRGGLYLLGQVGKQSDKGPRDDR